jgi:hypothetical protein
LPSESERILEIERIRSTLSHCAESLFWKVLWTCHKTEYGMNKRVIDFWDVNACSLVENYEHFEETYNLIV